LFRGVVKEATLSGLPAVAVANRGYYYSWTGAPGYVVKVGDPVIGTDLVGEVLQVGDWIQSDGTKWVHVPGDLLSKQRWDSLGSFAPWSDTSWEKGSVVSYQKAFFRASALISTGDLAPGVTAANPGEVQKWVDITPLPSISTGDLTNVNANTINGGGTHGAVFQWDDNVGEWVSSDVLEVSEVNTSTVRFETGYGELQGVADDISAVDDVDEGLMAPTVYAVKEYVKAQPKPFLEELEDCTELANAQDGEVPVWSNANSRWEPKSLTTPILYLGTGAWVAADVADAAKRYGMATDTVPDPAVWAPVPGDQYIDLSTGTVTVFTGAGGTTNPTRRAGAITGGAQPGLDALIEDLGGLSDVTLNAPADKQVLQYELTSKQWKNVTPDYLNPTNGYTKTEVDNKIGAVVTGLEHYEAVLSRVDTPPAAPTANDLYIVGATPTGLWTGQANNLARWDGAAWQFEAPKANESHLIESVAETWHWNGTAWVKVATATTTGGPAAAGDLWMVGAIQQSMLTEAEFKSLLNVTEQAKWCLADGRNVSGTKYATTTGRNTVPDLRGAYLRMAGVNATHTGWNGGTLNGYQEDNTARPRNVFTTNSTGNHKHWNGKTEYLDDAHVFEYGKKALNRSGWVGGNTDGFAQGLAATSTDGSHTHTITGGGDAETRPKSYSVNYFVKIN
jgi:hypothetical protein